MHCIKGFIFDNTDNHKSVNQFLSWHIYFRDSLVIEGRKGDIIEIVKHNRDLKC